MSTENGKMDTHKIEDSQPVRCTSCRYQFSRDQLLCPRCGKAWSASVTHRGKKHYLLRFGLLVLFSPILLSVIGIPLLLYFPAVYIIGAAIIAMAALLKDDD